MKTSKKIAIQNEIQVNQDWVDKQIKKYENMNERFSLSMGKFSGNGKKIAEEIKKMSEVGKQILMMHHRFEHSDFYKQNKDKIKQMENKNAKEKR